MKLNNLNLTLIVCATLITVQTIFIFIPFDFLALYHLIARPFTFILLAASVHILIGRDERKSSPNSIFAAVISVSIFGMAMLLLLLSFGSSRNAFAANISVVIQSLWTVGVCIVLGDFLRSKLIKSANIEEREIILNLITLVLVYSQMFDIHMLLNGSLDFLSIFFGYIFMPLIISYVATYFAINGSLFSVILFNFVFSMTTYLSPVLPNISSILFYVIVSGLAFISGICYYLLNNKPNRMQKMRIQRASRYSRRPWGEYAFFIIVVSVSALFFSGMFNVYPLAIRTGSMSPTFGRGSLVFVERVPFGEAFNMVGEGYVIHYVSPHNPNLSFTHRVVEFRTDVNGNRIFITMGDAPEAQYSYTYVSENEVRGIVRSFIPHAGLPAILMEEVFIRARLTN